MRRTIITARSTPPAMMMYQISRPTWLVRSAEGERGAGVLALGGRPGTASPRARRRRCCTCSRSVVRSPGLHADRVRASGPCTLGAVASRARRPTVIGCSRPLTSVTVSEPGAAGERHEVGAGDLHPVHLRCGWWRRGRAPGRPPVRASACALYAEACSAAPVEPVGHVVVVGEQVAEHGAGVHEAAGGRDVGGPDLVRRSWVAAVGQLAVVRSWTRRAGSGVSRSHGTSSPPKKSASRQ